jgi:hypothetical protein
MKQLKRLKTSIGDDFIIYFVDDVSKTLSEAFASSHVEC